jgi:hypothetical protein
MSYVKDRIKLAIARSFVGVADSLTETVTAAHRRNVVKAMARNAGRAGAGAVSTKTAARRR